MKEKETERDSTRTYKKGKCKINREGQKLKKIILRQ